jgi:hypothetical protein
MYGDVNNMNYRSGYKLFPYNWGGGDRNRAG